MKKFKWLGVSFLSSLLIAAGCGGDDDSGASGESESGSTESESISVAMVAGAESSSLKQLVPEFEEETGIEVEWNEFDYNTLYERIYNDLRTGTGTYDVIFADDPWMPMFAGGGFLTPLDELGYELDEDFAKMSREVSMWPAPSGPRLPDSDPDEEPRAYGIPQVGNVQLFFYRNDILNEAPETWSDLEAAIEEHQNEVDYGFVHRGARGNAIATNFNAFLWSHGADFFDEDWNVTLDSPEAIEALEFYIGMTEHAPDGIANYNADEIGRVMSKGEGLASIVWPVWGETMEDPEKSDVVGDIGYSLVPRAENGDFSPMIGNWILGIPQASENKEAALEFMTWASSEESQKQMTKDGGLPSRTSVLTDPELTEEKPYLEAVNEGLENANFRPRTPLYSEIENIYGTYLNQALTGDLTPEEALTGAAEEIEALMEDNGY
ncbi:extracellular solute-binding protein [Alteribacillus bidgolensis]|uniref:Carbohydrate ABC transporter substrate-binding protein, CUT1 family n=1 Tax=Alteribacillus bidgolensis TaxID=930129 RepID=A0A1G8K871_9BACI|nr:extracellular solute-binding protein [Alteribacillus bidgolensis]SDI39658.1 carbohydrate ABC transporter substrate-binding protein, CUT1 family [Alteribacillus bidgolensis]